VRISLLRCAALARATVDDLLLRPGLLLATVGVGALVTVLPRFAAPAFDRRGALAVELAFTTLTVYLALVLGIAGVWASGRSAELGPSDELRASPLGLREYVAARTLGLALAGAALVGVLTPFYILGYEWPTGVPAAPSAAVALGLAATAVLSATLVGTLGLFLGAVAPTPLAVLLLLASLAAARVLLPTISAGGGEAAALAALVPDPGRLDLSREHAFGPPPSTSSALFACAAATLQTAALALLAAGALGRRGA
jgi:hypothetical protein